VDCAITSPPYFRLRNYQRTDQMGLEETVEDWVQELMVVARQIASVLKPTGALWLNVGDSFSSSPRQGAPTKSLVMAPERLALAMTRDGWILRNKVIWAKTNPMPTSVSDRLGCTHEYLFFFVRQPHYYFDLDAIRAPHVSSARPQRAESARWSVPREWRGPNIGNHNGLARLKMQGLTGHPLGKNPGDVWSMATAGYRGQHHAVFPEKLVERPLLATCPPKVCSKCGAPWTRSPVKRLGQLAVAGVFHSDCSCNAEARPGVVLDPFMGSGTIAALAKRHARNWLGIELNPAFAAQVRARLRHIDRGPPKRTTE
jgi:DNA modification methylase